MLKISQSTKKTQLKFTSIGIQRVTSIWFPAFLIGLRRDEMLFHTAVLACADEDNNAYVYSDHEFTSFITLHQRELEQFINNAQAEPCPLSASVDLPTYPVLIHYEHPKPGHCIILCNRYLHDNA